MLLIPSTPLSPIGNRLRITPTESAKKLGAISLDAISDSEDYDEPFLMTKASERIYAHMIGLDEVTEFSEDVCYMSLPFTFWWKASIGRQSDMDTLHQALRVLNDQNLFDTSEPRSLLNVIENGRAGLGFNRSIPKDYHSNW